MTKDEVLRLAFEALHYCEALNSSVEKQKMQAITAIKKALAQPEQEFVIDGDTSDGYHTFNELYEFRKAYNVALFNEWAAANKCSVHKSWRHHDGEKCFGGGWFIVVAITPNGQISNHYEAKDWDLFKVPEVEKAVFEFDGHTGSDVINRLKTYTALAQPQREILGNVDYIPCCTDQTCPKCKPPQPEPKPVGSVVKWIDRSLIHGWFGEPPPEGTLLYTHPKEWVGLTDDEEILAISHTMPYANRFEFARAIEAKLRSKNNAV
jgi:hypothetical protein